MPQNVDGGKWYRPDEPVPAPPSSYQFYEQDGHTEYFHNGRTGKAYTWHYNREAGQYGWLVEPIQQNNACCGI